MPAADRAACEADVRELARLVRTASLDLMTATYPDATAKELSGQCLLCIETAARRLTNYRQCGNATTAMWEVHQAIEKVLKLYIRQHGTRPPFIHEVRELVKHAQLVGSLHVDNALLAKMPKQGAAIALRAGERLAGALLELMDVYRSGLRLLVQITSVLNDVFRCTMSRFS